MCLEYSGANPCCAPPSPSKAAARPRAFWVMCQVSRGGLDGVNAGCCRQFLVAFRVFPEAGYLPRASSRVPLRSPGLRHVLIGLESAEADPVHKATILPRGPAAGASWRKAAGELKRENSVPGF